MTAPTEVQERQNRPGARVDMGTLWLSIALAGFMLAAWWRPIPVEDFWWHVAVGQDVLQTGAIPRNDTYSWTMQGRDFFNQPWLSQIVMAAIYEAGGVRLATFTTGVIVGFTGLLLALGGLRMSRGDKRLCAAVLVLGVIPAASQNWTVRPQTLAYPLFAVALLLVLQRRTGSRDPRIWAIPLVVAIWANVHGSFLLAFAIVGLAMAAAAVDAGIRRSPDWSECVGWSQVLAMSVVASLLNPRGVALYDYVLRISRSPVVRTMVSEWARPDLTSFPGAMVPLVVAVVVVGYGARRRVPDVFLTLLAAVLLVFALTSVRNVVWFSFAAVPLVCHALSTGGVPRPSSEGSRTMNVLVATVLAFTLAVSTPWVRPAITDVPLYSGTPATTIMASVHRLDPQRLFNDVSYGSYLIWADVPVFFDTRFELYPTDHARDYADLAEGRHVGVLLDRYDFDAILIDTRDEPRLVKALNSAASWELVAHEGTTMLYRPARQAPPAGVRSPRADDPDS